MGDSKTNGRMKRRRPMKKKFLALVLTLAMVLSLVPVTALATGATQPNIRNSDPVTSNDGYVDLEKTAP